MLTARDTPQKLGFARTGLLWRLGYDRQCIATRTNIAAGLFDHCILWPHNHPRGVWDSRGLLGHLSWSFRFQRFLSLCYSVGLTGKPLVRKVLGQPQAELRNRLEQGYCPQAEPRAYQTPRHVVTLEAAS